MVYTFLDDEQIALEAFLAQSSCEEQDGDNYKMDEDLENSLILWKEYDFCVEVDLDLNFVCITYYLCDLGQFLFVYHVYSFSHLQTS